MGTGGRRFYPALFVLHNIMIDDRTARTYIKIFRISYCPGNLTLLGAGVLRRPSRRIRNADDDRDARVWRVWEGWGGTECGEGFRTETPRLNCAILFGRGPTRARRSSVIDSICGMYEKLMVVGYLYFAGTARYVGAISFGTNGARSVFEKRFFRLRTGTSEITERNGTRSRSFGKPFCTRQRF